jgi:predicted nucleic acid-binding protein
MDLFDTSALILAAHHAPTADQLRGTIEAGRLAVTDIVIVEYLNGARNLAEYDRFVWAFDAAARLRTEPEDWDRVFVVHRLLAETGAGHQRSVSVPDLVIAAVAERHGADLVHYDGDYDRIAAVTGQPVRWVVPRGSV